MEKIKKNDFLYSGLVNSILLYLFTSLTYKLWPSFFPINKVSGIIISIFLIAIIIRHIKVKELVIYFLIILFIIVSTSFSQEFMTHINDAIYWMITCLFLVKLCDSKFRKEFYNCLCNKEKLLKYEIIFCNFLLIIGLLLPNCYVYEWEDIYYIGFSIGLHAFSSSICLLLSLTFVILGEKYVNFKNVIWFIPGMIGIFFSGARTYLISYFVIITLFYMFYLKRTSLKMLLMPIIVFVFCYILLKSNMLDKFINAASNTYSSTNTLVAFSNGRLDFWLIDINSFFKSNFINILFGNGFDYVYIINKTYYHMRIWAHNDFIDCALSVGLNGLVLYMYLFYSILQNFRKNYSKMLRILITIYILFVAFVNGLFLYQHYLYSIVILYIVLTNNPIFNKDKVKEVN